MVEEEAEEGEGEGEGGWGEDADAGVMMGEICGFGCNGVRVVSRSYVQLGL